jgi:hypothetical protein
MLMNHTAIFGDVNEKVFFSDVNEQGKWQLVMLMDTGIVLQWQSVMLMDKGILLLVMLSERLIFGDVDGWR